MTVTRDKMPVEAGTKVGGVVNLMKLVEVPRAPALPVMFSELPALFVMLAKVREAVPVPVMESVLAPISVVKTPANSVVLLVTKLNVPPRTVSAPPVKRVLVLVAELSRRKVAPPKTELGVTGNVAVPERTKVPPMT